MLLPAWDPSLAAEKELDWLCVNGHHVHITAFYFWTLLLRSCPTFWGKKEGVYHFSNHDACKSFITSPVTRLRDSSAEGPTLDTLSV